MLVCRFVAGGGERKCIGKKPPCAGFSLRCHFGEVGKLRRTRRPKADFSNPHLFSLFFLSILFLLLPDQILQQRCQKNLFGPVSRTRAVIYRKKILPLSCNPNHQYLLRCREEMPRMDYLAEFLRKFLFDPFVHQDLSTRRFHRQKYKNLPPNRRAQHNVSYCSLFLYLF